MGRGSRVAGKAKAICLIEIDIEIIQGDWFSEPEDLVYFEIGIDACGGLCQL